MKRFLPALLIFAIGCGGTAKARLVDVGELPFAHRYQLAVVDFENATGLPEYDALVGGLGETMISEFAKYGRVRLIERIRLEAVLEELRIEMSGLIQPRNAKRVGKQLGVDALLLGSLKQVTHKRKRHTLGIAHTTGRKTKVILSGRVVLVESGEILASADAATTVKQTHSVALGFAKTGGISDEATAARQALEVAVVELANRLAAKTPPKS